MILVVDADRNVYDGVRAILAPLNRSVTWVRSATEALAQVRRAAPLLMLVNLEPTTTIGWDLLECIERDSAIEAFPVIVTTSSRSVLAAHRSAGVDWPILTCPIDGEKLLALARELTSHAVSAVRPIGPAVDEVCVVGSGA